MDITTIVGMIVCIVVVFFGIITGVDGFAGIPHFGDAPSVFYMLYDDSGKRISGVYKLI